jgi:hypothetical protein
MKKCLLILFVVSACCADGLFIETGFENRFPPKYFDQYSVVLQELNIVSVYFYSHSVLVGMGYEPGVINSFSPDDNTIYVNWHDAYGIWLSLFYAKKLPLLHSIACLGGRLGSMTDKYDLQYDRNGTQTPVVQDYQVKDAYVASIGPKFIFGFKYVRFVIEGFLNMGNRTELYNDYDYYHDSWYEEGRTHFITSWQFDFALTTFIGRD